MPPKKTTAKPVAASAKKKGGVVRVQKKRAKKDKDAPKKAKSAYICFVGEARKVLIAKDPALEKNVIKIGSMLGAQWKKMTDVQKEPYDKMAADDKVRYQREKAAYVKK